MTPISNFAVTRDSSPWPSYPDLAGKVAVVTGGSRGLGAAACRALAANEVKVAVNGRDGSAIDATVSEIGDAGDTQLPRRRIAPMRRPWRMSATRSSNN